MHLWSVSVAGVLLFSVPPCSWRVMEVLSGWDCKLWDASFFSEIRLMSVEGFFNFSSLIWDVWILKFLQSRWSWCAIVTCKFCRFSYYENFERKLVSFQSFHSGFQLQLIDCWWHWWILQRKRSRNWCSVSSSSQVDSFAVQVVFHPLIFQLDLMLFSGSS